MIDYLCASQELDFWGTCRSLCEWAFLPAG